MVRRGLADTSLFIANEAGRRLDTTSIPSQIAVSMITYGELRLGVLAAPDLVTRERRLATLMYVAQLDLVPVDQAVAEAWAALRARLKEQRRAMKVNDSWIAATANALGVPVVTQDGDFEGIEGLQVVNV